MTRFCSIFSQLLQLFPRTEFQQAVAATQAERHARGFTCWGQFVAMLFCQLGRAHSLREICGGLASCEGKLAHLGIEAPSRTTLSYANAHRPWQLYERVCYQLLAKCQHVAGGTKFRFKNKLVSLDATVIDLCAEMFPWATFRRTKGAVKRHGTLDNDGYLPTALVITEGTRHEVTVARQATYAPGTILIVDRGYVDFGWFATLDAAGVYFVTRLKDRTAYTVIDDDRSRVEAGWSPTRRSPSPVRRVRRSTSRAARSAGWKSNSRTGHAWCSSRIISGSARRRSRGSTKTAGRSNASSRRSSSTCA
jgi:hypothetical protein